MRVGDICTRDPVCVGGHTTLTDVARTMRAAHVGAVIVVDERGGRRVPLGVLTDRDVVVGVLAAEEEHFGLCTASTVMGPHLVTVREDEDLAPVLTTMRTAHVRRVPVLDASGALLGVLSVDDVMAALTRELQDVAAIVSEQRGVERRSRP
jgi:CBS domain-containing protein